MKITPVGTYTLNQAIDKAGIGRFHWLVLLLTGQIYIVYASQAIAQAFLIPIIKDDQNLASPWDSLIAVAFFIGTLLGNIIWSKLADIHGRKKAIIFGFLIKAIAATATGLATNIYIMLVVQRAPQPSTGARQWGTEHHKLLVDYKYHFRY